MQPGERPITYADSKDKKITMNSAVIDIREDFRKFAEWYQKYHRA